MTYRVWYRRPGAWFWRQLKTVKGDGFIESSRNRYFIMADESRVEIPGDYMFWFSRERFMSIKANAEAQAGRPLPMRA